MHVAQEDAPGEGWPTLAGRANSPVWGGQQDKVCLTVIVAVVPTARRELVAPVGGGHAGHGLGG